MTERIPGLDRVRAAAILLVVACHVQVFVHPLTGWAAWVLTDTAWCGVYLFFVLSGYLIGRLLLADIQSTGGIRFKRFWVRRALRTWPLYLLALAANYWLAPHAVPPAPSIWAYLSFTQIFFRMTYFIESWSLSVEELFYLVAPLVVLVAWRLAGRRGLLAASTLVILAAWAVRLRTGYRLHPAALFDSLFVGVLVAVLETFGSRAFTWWRGRHHLALALGTAIAVLPFALGGALRVRQTQGLLALGFGMVLVAALHAPRGPTVVHRTRLWRAIAVSSYSTYLTHAFVVRGIAAAAPDSSGLSAALGWPLFALSIGAALAAGGLVYVLVEQPLLAARDALTLQRPHLVEPVRPRAEPSG